MPLDVPTARTLRRRALGGAAAALLASGLAACGDDTDSPDASANTTESSGSSTPSPSDSPAGSPSPSPSKSKPAGQTLAIQVAGDKVTPVAEQIDLAVGEPLTLTVTSDRAGELHVHSDPEHEFEFSSGTQKYKITLQTPGSVDIEEHESDALVARVLVR